MATGRIAIVGAGIAGATAARTLFDQGFDVRVFDKGRVPGGRSAARVDARGSFDHGAQYFTARDPRFVSQVQTWEQAGLIALWSPRLWSIEADGLRPTLGRDRRWVALPDMRAIAGNLLTGVDVRYAVTVTATERGEHGWQLHFADGRVESGFDALIGTPPAPQARALWRDEALTRQLRDVDFLPCWALMLEFEQALPTEIDAAFVNVGPLSWIARDSSKPGRAPGERWLVHAGTDFSRLHLEWDASAVIEPLFAAFGTALGLKLPAPHAANAHRWRYALAAEAMHAGALSDPSRQLALGGDWCHGSRVEGAYLSGLALAASAAGFVSAAGR